MAIFAHLGSSGVDVPERYLSYTRKGTCITRPVLHSAANANAGLEPAPSPFSWDVHNRRFSPACVTVPTFIHSLSAQPPTFLALLSPRVHFATSLSWRYRSLLLLS